MNKSIEINNINVELNIIDTPNGQVWEGNFQAKLLSIGSNVLYLNNDKKTEYRICTGEFTRNGKTVQSGFMVWESNLTDRTTGEVRMSVGETYLSTLRITPGQPHPGLTMSHLTSAARATFDTFGINMAEFAIEEDILAKN